jgi:hypothetical protein
MNVGKININQPEWGDDEDTMEYNPYNLLFVFVSNWGMPFSGHCQDGWSKI